jgi:hypothetical protein
MAYSFAFVTGNIFTLELEETQKISDAKALIKAQFPEVDIGVLKLIFRSTILPDETELRKIGLMKGDVIIVQPKTMRPSTIPSYNPNPEPIDPSIQPLPIAIAPDVRRLMELGYDQEQSELALLRHENNLDRAAAYLAVKGTGSKPIPSPAPQPPPVEHRPVFSPEVADLANRLRANPGAAPQIISNDWIGFQDHIKDILARNPPEFFHKLGLNPVDYDLATIARQAQQRLGSRGNVVNHEAVIQRLLALAPDLGYRTVRDVYEQSGQDEARAAATIREFLE